MRSSTLLCLSAVCVIASGCATETKKKSAKNKGNTETPDIVECSFTANFSGAIEGDFAESGSCGNGSDGSSLMLSVDTYEWSASITLAQGLLWEAGQTHSSLDALVEIAEWGPSNWWVGDCLVDITSIEEAEQTSDLTTLSVIGEVDCGDTPMQSAYDGTNDLPLTMNGKASFRFEYFVP